MRRKEAQKKTPTGFSCRRMNISYKSSSILAKRCKSLPMQSVHKPGSSDKSSRIVMSALKYLFIFVSSLDKFLHRKSKVSQQLHLPKARQRGAFFPYIIKDDIKAKMWHFFQKFFKKFFRRECGSFGFALSALRSG